MGKKLFFDYDIDQRQEKNMNNPNILGPLDILTSGQKESLKLKHLKKGDILYREGDQPHGLYFLQKGLLGLTMLSESGAESLVRIFPEQSFCGHRSLIAQEEYHASAVALKACEILFIEAQAANKLLLENNELLMFFSRCLARDLKIAESRFNDMIGKRAYQRVVDSIVFLKHKNSQFPWTRREIGEFCGVKMETVSRILSELEENGLIKKEGRSIKIIDEAKLLNSYSS